MLGFFTIKMICHTTILVHQTVLIDHPPPSVKMTHHITIPGDHTIMIGHHTVTMTYF